MYPQKVITLFLFLIAGVSTLQAEVLLAWHTPADEDAAGGDITPDIFATGISGLADTAVGRPYDNGVGNGSNDDTFGRVPIGSTPVSVASWALESSNVGRSELALTLTNNTGSDVILAGLHFDHAREFDFRLPPTDITASYLNGDLSVTDNTTLVSIIGTTTVVDAGAGDYADIYVDLTSMADYRLATGESATFQIKVSGANAANNASLFIDNVAITGTVVTSHAPAIVWQSGAVASDTALNGVDTLLSGTAVSNGTNGSTDGSYGTISTVAPITGGAFALTNNQFIDIAVTNNAGRRVYLSRLSLDFNPRNADAPTDVTVSYLSGDLNDPDTTAVGSLTGQAPVATDLADYHDLDMTLSDALSDTFLDDGESATFRITLSGALGADAAYIDNIGFLAYRAPNLLVLMSDDQGYADVDFNKGNSEVPTPNINRIATAGVNCTNAYVSYPVCGPSRAGFITGRYAHRFGYEKNPQYRDPIGAVPQEEMTIADAVEQVGYHSSIIGKWHLGAKFTGHPLNRGFDEFYGFLGGGHQYFKTGTSFLITNQYDAKDEDQSYRMWILRNHDHVDPATYVDPGPNPGEEWYLTDELSAEAVDFIDRNQAAPWFLYMSYNAPHGPNQSPQRYIDRFPTLQDYGKDEVGNPYIGVSAYPRQTYAAMVSAMDDGIGLILDKLEELDLVDDTLIFFLSDNGGKIKTGANNDPLKGGKSDVYEGGMRVPYAVSWPGAIPQGEIYEDPVMSLDVFGTIAAVAGAPTHPDRPLDGVNIVPFLTGLDTSYPHDEVYERKHGQGWYAVRSASDDFKFVRQEGTYGNQLFDLANDISETNNLASGNAARLAELMTLRDIWEAGLIDPIFVGISDPIEDYFDKHNNGTATAATINQSMLDVESPTAGTWTLNAGGTYTCDKDNSETTADKTLDISIPASGTDEMLATLTLDTAITLGATTQVDVFTQLLNINNAVDNGIRIEFQDGAGVAAASIVWGGTNIGTTLNSVAFGAAVPFTAADETDGRTGWDQYDASVRNLQVELTRELVTVNFDGSFASGSIQNNVTEIQKIALYSLAGGSLATALYLDEIAVDVYTVGAYSPFTTAWDSGSTTPDTSMTGITAQLTTTAATSTTHGSTDGSYGTYNVIAPSTGGAFELYNNDFIDVAITNVTGGKMMLETLWLDFNRDRVESPTDVTVTYLSGDLDDTPGASVGSLINQSVMTANLTNFDDLDCDLGATLTDTVLASGETATFRITVSGASGTQASYIDNIGFGTLLLSGIEAVTVQGNGDLRFNWTGESGRTYNLEHREDLATGTWTTIETYYGTGSQLQVDITPAPDEPTGFYRVVVQ